MLAINPRAARCIGSGKIQIKQKIKYRPTRGISLKRVRSGEAHVRVSTPGQNSSEEFRRVGGKSYATV